MRQEIENIYPSWQHVSLTKSGYIVQREVATARLLALFEKMCNEVIDMVEPCDEDCSPERHAYHEGQWSLHLRQQQAHKTKLGD